MFYLPGQQDPRRLVNQSEQTSKQATPPIGHWFFVERSTLIVLEPKANWRGTTEEGEATTDHGQPILVLVRVRTDERHIF